MGGIYKKGKENSRKDLTTCFNSIYKPWGCYLWCVGSRCHWVQTLQVCSIQSCFFSSGDVLLQLGKVLIILMTGKKKKMNRLMMFFLLFKILLTEFG